MKVIYTLCILLFLNGCTVLTIGASAISSIIDRYEKYKIEERLEELEKDKSEDF